MYKDKLQELKNMEASVGTIDEEVDNNREIKHKIQQVEQSRNIQLQMTYITTSTVSGVQQGIK